MIYPVEVISAVITFLGRPVRVTYDEIRGLHVEGLSMQESDTVVRALSSVTTEVLTALAAAAQVAQDATVPAPVEAAPVEAPKKAKKIPPPRVAELPPTPANTKAAKTSAPPAAILSLVPDPVPVEDIVEDTPPVAQPVVAPPVAQPVVAAKKISVSELPENFKLPDPDDCVTLTKFLRILKNDGLNYQQAYSACQVALSRGYTCMANVTPANVAERIRGSFAVPDFNPVVHNTTSSTEA